MAIDKSKKYWRGDAAEDVVEFLDEYSENEVSKVVIIKCRQCDYDIFTFKIDADKEVIEVTCTACNKKRLLLDSEKCLEKSDPKDTKCSGCKKDRYNLAVGFVHRRNGEVKRVYIGHRCSSCGVLESCGDWGINYGSTKEMEENV